MRTDTLRHAGLRLLLILLLVPQTWGYDFSRNDDGQAITWNAGTVTMQVQLGSATVLSDGTTYNSSVQAAMQIWNAQIGGVQFTNQIAAPAAPINNNQVNEIGFDSTVYGTAFDANVLAVAYFYYSGTSRPDGTSRMTQADIIFNTTYTWDSYRGAVRAQQDIQRVAIHELGHVLGLDHPDQATPPQSVTALMNSHVSNLDTLAADDIAGAQALYGVPGVPFFTTRPLTQSVIVGNAVSFTAQASSPNGSAISYAWRRNGQAVAGATTDTLALASTNLADDGYYEVVATNSAGSSSSYFKLHVTADHAGVMVVGLNDAGQTTVPAGLGKLLAVSNGTRHTLVLKADGTVAAWGESSHNQLAIPSGLSGVVAIAAGGTHSMALKSNGTVVAWGDSTYSLNGPGATVPVGLSNAIDIAGGWGSGLALRADGTVATWGFLGGYAIPASVKNIVGIAGGPFHALALKSDGTVVAWGGNSFGESTLPGGLAGVVAVAAGGTAGGDFSLALKSDGTVVGWGYNYYGQCNVPAGLNNVVAIAAGGNYSLALKSDGTVVSWGQNTDSQQTLPSGIGFVYGVAAGYAHTSVLIRATVPTIALPPVSQTVNTGDTATFSATATGIGPFSYQWKYNGTALTNSAKVTGATSATLAIANAQLSDEGNYTVEVTNAGGTAVSSAAVLNVAIPPGFSQVPGSRVTAEGQTVSFTVAPIVGGPFTYQWKRNRQVIPGANQATFSLPSVTTDDSAYYEAIVTNADGGISTTRFYLAVAVANPTLIAWGDYAPPVPNISGSIAAIAVSGASYALKGDGTVVAWSNTAGQPALPAGLNGIVAISPGEINTLALKSDGTVVGWGSDAYGSATPPVGLTGVVAISAGYDHSLALKADGTVVAWGNNNYGQCNVPAGLKDAVAIATGGLVSLALKSDGAIVIWGNNSYPDAMSAGLTDFVALACRGSLYLGLRANGNVVAWGQSYADSTVVPAGLANVRAISAGGDMPMAIRTDGTLVTWGRNYEHTADVPSGLNSVVAAAAGYGSSLALTRTLPAGIVVSPASKTVVAGDYVTLSVTASGTLPMTHQWRKNGVNLGNGNGISGANTATLSFTSVQPADAGSYDVVVTTAGGSATSALAVLTVKSPPAITARPLSKIATVGQSVTFTAAASSAVQPITYQWRHNGQDIPGATLASLTIGNVTLADRGYYELVIGNADATTWTVFLLTVVGGAATDFTVMPWGHDFYGNSGPDAVPADLHNVVAVAAGEHHAAAVLGDGTVRAWGVPNFGQTAVPAGLANVVGVAAGSYHTLALLANGTVQSWGNYSGSPSPVPAGLRNVVSISARGTSNVALKSDGTVVTWGMAAAPAGLNNVVAIAAGSGHALALKSDGTVVAWGSNSYGKATVPSGLANVAAIGAGDDHSLAVKSDGTVVAWGRNDVGQSTVPGGLANVVSVAGGFVHSIALRANGTVAGWGRDNEGEATPPAGLVSVAAISAGAYYNLVLVPTAPVAITTQPVGQTISIGQSATLSVAVTGTRPTFRWRRNGVNLSDGPGISGAATATLSLFNAVAAMTGSYDVVVSNPVNIVISNSTQVTVNQTPVFNSRPLSRLVQVGQPVTLTASTDDPGTYTYQWRHNGVLIPGATGPTLNFAAVSYADRGRYVLTVSGGAASISSVFFLNIGPSGPANASLVMWTKSGNTATQTVLSNAPGIVDVVAGRDLFCALKSDGTAAGWGVAISSFSPVMSASGLVALSANDHNIVALKADGTVVANYAAAVQSLYDVVQVAASHDSSYALRADGTVVTWNDASSFHVVAGLSGIVSIAAGDYHLLALKSDGTVVVADSDGWGEQNIPAGLAHVSVIAAGYGFNVVLKDDGTVVAWGRNDNGQTLVPAGLTGVVSLSSSFFHTVALKSDGTAVEWGSTYNGVTPVVPAEYAGQILVASAGAYEDVAILSNVPFAAPTIQVQPQARFGAVGQAVTFTVAASGPPPPTYQWKKNGVDIPLATAASYSIASVSLADAGSYSVVVTNPLGSVVSSSATLTLSIPAAIVTQPVSQMIIAGNPVTFTATASGNPAPTYQWRKNGVNIAGATNSSYTIAGTTTTDAASYTVVATNSLGNVTSHPATLTVIPVRPQTFDAQRYLVLNGDVAAAIGNVTDKLDRAWTHYYLFGIAEGRSDGDFDAAAYLATYADLRVLYGTDLRAAAMQWYLQGRLEGRRIPSGFSASGYLAHNPDLQVVFGTDLYASWRHYWNYGLNEGRVFDNLFRVDEYLGLNGDLQAAFGTDRQAALLHWLNYGKAEGRLGRVPLTFGIAGYLARYADLQAVFGGLPVAQRNVGVWNHYLDYGVYEGRSDGDFDVHAYLAEYADLSAAFGNNLEAAALHWYIYGRYEGRRIPLNFNVQSYLTRYPDIAAAYGLDLYGAWLHYREYGINEGRVYDELFRVDEYLALYADLRAVFGTDREAALMHWLLYGKAEGRRGRYP